MNQAAVVIIEFYIFFAGLNTVSINAGDFQPVIISGYVGGCPADDLRELSLQTTSEDVQNIVQNEFGHYVGQECGEEYSIS